MLKEYIIALSLTNLCFYNIILTFFYKNKFYLKDFPGTNQLIALILSELLIATVFWLAWRLIKKINNRYLTNAAKAFICLLVLIFIYDLARDFKSIINLKFFRICLLLLLITLSIRKKMAKTAVSFLLILAPFIGIVFFQSIQGIATDLTKKSLPEIKQPIFSRKNNLPRVLWLLFDGFDYRIAFIDKPYNLELPAFDRLRHQALFAHNAYPPGNKTRSSIAALIDGKIISEAHIGGYDQLSIVYQDDNQSINWGSKPNVFSRAKELEINTALVGEYMPYSRLIGKDLTYCEWYQYYPQFTSSGSIIDNMWQQIRMLLIGPARHYTQRKEAYIDVHNQTKKLISNLDYNLIMIHNPIPHAPYFYQQGWWTKSSPEGYAKALKLADLTLDEIHRIMEEQGVWDKTNIIISSDHGLTLQYDGKTEKRVPFIVKLAGQNQPVIYEPAFNTVVTQELVMAILRGAVTCPDQLVEFLQKNGRMIEPTTIND